MQETLPRICQKGPYAFEVCEGKKYAWCACGLSNKQPLCDGSHKGCGISPVIYKAEETKTIYFCGCKKTSNPPLCDGAHSSL